MEVNMKNIDKYKNQILAIIFFSVYIFLTQPWFEYGSKLSKFEWYRINKITGKVEIYEYDKSSGTDIWEEY